MTEPRTDSLDIAGLLARWRDELPSRTALGRVFDVADPARAGTLLRAWKRDALSDSARWPEARRVHVALAGFTTLSYVAPHVEAAALADGFAPRVTLGGYDQLVQDLTAPHSPVLGSDIDILWVWVNLTDLLPAGFRDDPAALASSNGNAAAEAAATELGALLHGARRHTKALLLVNAFTPLRRAPLGIADGASRASYEDAFQAANARLRQALTGIGSAHVFPLDHLLRRTGIERACDPRLQLAADCLFTPEFNFRVAAGLRPYVRALKGAASKVLVLDLDNTLWGGVVGEDGWDGVRIGDDPVGKAYQRFQAAILELHRRGVVLAINSKNNPGDVEELFRRREEMRLRLEHFAAARINWTDKAANCRAIAEELNLGLDSFVLWDDNPAERALVRETLEDVQVVDVPRDASRWADLLRELTWFDTLRLTAEDLERSRMYAEDRQRREAAGVATDLEAFLASLELVVGVVPASDANVPRIASLLGRTNQFNLTTRRHAEPRVREMAADPSWSVLSYAADDRFGSYGIVGVTIAHRTADAAEIDSFLLSCRALGKGIETTMLAQMGRIARQWDVTKIRATFIPTKKNVLIQDFLPASGFRATADRDGTIDYEFDLALADLEVPPYVRVDLEEPSAR